MTSEETRQDPEPPSCGPCQWIVIQNDEAGIFVQCPGCERVWEYRGTIMKRTGFELDLLATRLDRRMTDGWSEDDDE